MVARYSKITNNIMLSFVYFVIQLHKTSLLMLTYMKFVSILSKDL